MGVIAAFVGVALLVGKVTSSNDGALSGGDYGPPKPERAIRGRSSQHAVVELEDGGVHPSRVRVARNKELDLVVRNLSSAVHHFIVDSFGVHEDLQPGSSARVIVADARRGTYVSWCAYDGHLEHVAFVVT
jgi:heme/copper-type cytochrome/quinol oxidase subunit 2